MFEGPGPHIFALPPGVDFPAALVAGLRARLQGQPPEAMARVTLYVNTTRMRRRITDIFAADGATLLPRLLLVSNPSAGRIGVGLAPPVPALRRLLQLSVLIGGLLDQAPDLAPRSAIADLAESLGALMSEMQGEGVTPDRIAGLDVSEFSEHWARTRAFLTIIAPFFTQDASPSAEGRQRAVALALGVMWDQAPPIGPIIVAGSTASRGATALFMRAVAGLPQGALVLPGLDPTMPPAVWDVIADPLTAQDHPQYRLGRMLRDLGVEPVRVMPWAGTPPPSAARNAVISLALRPAPVTDQWLIEGQALPDLPDAMRGVSLVEASSPRTEALAIALILRQAADDGTSAALVSPDRTLTRRVAAALARWGIRPDDSAGIPLNQTAPGRMLRHVVRMFGARAASDALLVLLKHPLTASAIERGVHLLLSRDLELSLRKEGPAFPSGADLVAWGAAQTHEAALGWATALAGAIDGLEDVGAAPLSQHVARTKAMAERLARGPAPDGTGELWKAAPGEAALAFMTDLAAEAEHSGTLTPAEYRALFDTLIAGVEVRDPTIPHPHISIWGTIEARVQGADLVILGGLNEGVWPGMPAPDPWLNRKMRQEAGLLAPEREIGLAAHDFQQAVAAPRVVISRALRNAEAETVPSRWLNRLLNLMAGLPGRGGDVALAQMRGRGQAFLAIAAAMDRPLANPPPDLIPVKRPSPRPPVDARPKSLSLTRIEALIRDPYAIYADKILRLRPLNPMRPKADARDRGTVVHAVLERFVVERPVAETRDAARTRLMQIAAEVLTADVPWPAARALWAARLDRAADHFLTVDARDGGQAVMVEAAGSLALPSLDFTLFGTPDRIDRLPDGSLHLIDYKTGAPPSTQQQEHFATQLHLAAFMAERGGFASLGPQAVAKVTYVGLGSKGKVSETLITEDILSKVHDGIERLIGGYNDPKQGYAARRAVFTETFPGDYDHLARFGEWEMTDTPVPQDVGKDAPDA